MRDNDSKETGDLKGFMADGDVGNQIAGFFDGGQIDPVSSKTGVSHGLFLLRIALAG